MSDADRPGPDDAGSERGQAGRTEIASAAEDAGQPAAQSTGEGDGTEASADPASESDVQDGSTAQSDPAAQSSPAANRTEPIRVLNLVTNDHARFFQQQVAALEARGVEIDTIAVPDDHRPGSSRSLTDYLRILPPTIRGSFGEYDFVHANNGLTLPAAIAQPKLPVLATLWGSDLLGQYGR